jgi:two-component system, chemotaxis family, response regulator Rcp1
MGTAAASTKTQAFRALLVEDNPGDARLLREALKVVTADVELQSVANTREALAFLGNLSPYESAPKPDLIILDVLLPGMNGLQALGIIRTTPAWSHIPAVIFTSLDRVTDRAESKRLGATTYKVKPEGFDGYVAFARSLTYFLRNGNRSAM